jgi:hypothetical protein
MSTLDVDLKVEFEALHNSKCPKSYTSNICMVVYFIRLMTDPKVELEP